LIKLDTTAGDEGCPPLNASKVAKQLSLFAKKLSVAVIHSSAATVGCGTFAYTKHKIYTTFCNFLLI